MIRSFPTNAATFATVTWVMRAAGAAETPAVVDHLSSTEFLEEIRKAPFAVPPTSAATFMALNVRTREQDAVSVNGEEGDEASRRLVASAGSTILGTLQGRFREVESAFL
jgi:hypothetical protein